MPQLLRTLLLFVLAGPLIGGIVAGLAFTVTIVLPDLWSDPSNTYGHARWTEYFGTLALIMIFAYPIGMLPATASAAAQICIRDQPLRLRPGGVLFVCAAGVFVMALQQALFRDTTLLPLLASAVAAAACSLFSVRVPMQP